MIAVRAFSRAASCLVTAAVLWTGCSPIEVEAKDIEVKHRDIPFAPVPAALSGVLLAAAQSFEVDSALVPWAGDVDQKVEVREVTLHATSGVTALDFIQLASVAVSDVARSQPAVQVVSYNRATAAASGPDLQVTNSQPVDVSVAWSGDRVRIDLAITGTLPATAWSADVTIGLSGRVTYRYWQ